MLKSMVLAGFMVLTAAGMAQAQPEALDDTAMDIKNKMREHFKGFTVQRVVPSEIDGLYEVQGSDGILYTDGNYILKGHLFTMDGKKDLTQEKLDSMAQEKIVMDTSAALTVRDGNGGLEVIMITDPECPYCATADTWFKGKNVTRKIMFLPLSFHPQARPMSEHILCADDPAAEYKKMMDYSYDYYNTKHTAGDLGEYLGLQGVKLNTCAQGQAQLDNMRKAIADIGITGTPMFIIDGKLYRGADEAVKDQLR